MATTFLPATGLGYPALGDTYPAVIQADLTLLDGMSPLGGLFVSLHEQPSTSLNVKVAAGAFRTPWGQTVAYAGSASQAVTASATTYLWLTTAGTLTTGNAWPTTAYIPLAIVIAGASTITSITDFRNVCSTVIPIAQPTMGAATAGATYTAAEQAMLQAVYSAVRALGLGT
jgi:hypothetical protein